MDIQFINAMNDHATNSPGTDGSRSVHPEVVGVVGQSGGGGAVRTITQPPALRAAQSGVAASKLPRHPRRRPSGSVNK
jgi:hypothetical protein